MANEFVTPEGKHKLPLPVLLTAALLSARLRAFVAPLSERLLPAFLVTLVRAGTGLRRSAAGDLDGLISHLLAGRISHLPVRSIADGNPLP
jgi:hypothetical protein